jgi:hypothetical protein
MHTDVHKCVLCMTNTPTVGIYMYMSYTHVTHTSIKTFTESLLCVGTALSALPDQPL